MDLGAHVTLRTIEAPCAREMMHEMVLALCNEMAFFSLGVQSKHGVLLDPSADFQDGAGDSKPTQGWGECTAT